MTTFLQSGQGIQVVFAGAEDSRIPPREPCARHRHRRYSSSDVLRPDGRVLDTDRVLYLRNYLGQLHRATSESVPVKGYFLWSLLDNYEWSDGFSKRFGITYVEVATEKRTPKLSFDFYKEVIHSNSVV